MKTRFFFLLLLIFNTVYSYTFTKEQIDNLKECVEISRLFNNSPSLVCSIMLNETAAGRKMNSNVGDRFLRPFKRSYGLMQIRLTTAEDMINRFHLDFLKKIPAEEILVYLMEDKKFNIAMANVFISYLKKKYHGNIKKIVIAYNRGHFSELGENYYRRFLENRKLFLEFERKYLSQN